MTETQNIEDIKDIEDLEDLKTQYEKSLLDLKKLNEANIELFNILSDTLETQKKFKTQEMDEYITNLSNYINKTNIPKKNGYSINLLDIPDDKLKSEYNNNIKYIQTKLWCLSDENVEIKKKLKINKNEFNKDEFNKFINKNKDGDDGKNNKKTKKTNFNYIMNCIILFGSSYCVYRIYSIYSKKN